MIQIMYYKGTPKSIPAGMGGRKGGIHNGI